ncbi:MAG: DUF2975 domain-containing protein [bacterium]
MPEQTLRRNRLAAVMTAIMRVVNILSWVVAIITGIAFVLYIITSQLGLFAHLFGSHTPEDFPDIGEIYETGLIFITSFSFVFISRELIVVLKTITHRTPFEKENGERFAFIAKILMVAEIAKIGLFLFVGILTIITPLDWENTSSLGIDPSAWMAAGIALVLAEVFREGARLREEQELTV